MWSDLFAKLKAIVTEEVPSHFNRDGLAGVMGLSLAERFGHFWAMTIRSFVRNRCMVRASALAYSSLLALVPMLAIALSVSAGILDKKGEQPILDFVDKMVMYIAPETTVRDPAPATKKVAGGKSAPTPAASTNGVPATVAGMVEGTVLDRDARKEVAQQIKQFIGNIRTGTLTISGSALLIFLVISMLARIEDTFNDIWGVEQGRNWVARITHYWAALTLGPILLIAAISTSSWQQVQSFQTTLSELPYGVGATVRIGFSLIPFLILTFGFAMFYKLMPNTRVQWRSAFVGGAIGGGLWQINSLLGVLYVSRVVTNSKIYGSLGMVPVLMIGLYFSWLFLLFGAQVAYTHQNRRAFVQERLMESVNHQGREVLAVRIMAEVSRCFQRGRGSLSAAAIADAIGVPSRLVVSVVQTLLDDRLLVALDGEEPAFLPGRPLEQVTFHDIMAAVRNGRAGELSVDIDPAGSWVAARYRQVLAVEEAAGRAVTLAQLVQAAPHAEAAPAGAVAGQPLVAPDSGLASASGNA